MQKADFDFSQGVSIDKVMSAAAEIEIIHSTLIKLQDETTFFLQVLKMYLIKYLKLKYFFQIRKK